MKKFGYFVCNNKKTVIVISFILLILSFIGISLTKVNYDILVYLPKDIETIKGQNILVDDFNIGAYSIAVVDDMNSHDILLLEDEIRKVDGVSEVVSLYDVDLANIPISMLPKEVVDKCSKDQSYLLLITFNNSTSSNLTIDAVKKIRSIANKKVGLGGMSSMVLDTMNLSQQELAIYIIIAVILCTLVLELSMDSYILPFLLLINIGCAILYNLGSNVFLGQISYITKALVAVLQLGVTTDFSIFLYHSYEDKKKLYNTKEEAMIGAIKETFISVTGSALTTVVGFIALCSMKLTLGRDLGIVMAKGVLLGVITVLTLFPSLILYFDNLIEKTKHKKITLRFGKINKFIIKNHVAIFAIFMLLFVPTYLAQKKVDIYYKLDSSLPETLESVKTNKVLKENYNIVSPEIILINKNIKNDEVINMIEEIEKLDGIDFVLSFAKLKKMGVVEDMLPQKFTNIFLNDNYQMILVNSSYDIATDKLNNQINLMNKIVKKYDKKAIVAGEGPLMKDLVQISNTDFNNVNTLSIICIFVVLFLVLRSISLPFLLIFVIEFAIFLNMGVSYFKNDSLPFIAPIVLGTIQLGATIDYAILLTTTYLNKRRIGKEKKEAMEDALNYCSLSILVSGMCFFSSTFGVGLYSKIEMIGSLCTLISRGALISMIVVITILPSTLLIFDKLILKTTLNKKETFMKKKLQKKLSMILIINLLIFNPVCTFAMSKNETVYSKLNADGSIKNTIVNEQLINSNKEDTINDYSELENILNLNGDSTFEEENKNLKWNALGKDILYQGTINKDLPVKVLISYKLDGEDFDLSEILGKKGNVTISLKYINNDKHGSIYTPFVVTAGTIIDTENNTNIAVTNGKIVTNNSASYDIIVGLALPGLYESLGLENLNGMDTITINFDTENFSLPTIYSVITPKLIEVNDLDIFNELDSIYKNVDILQDNMNKINEGASKLKEGSNTLKDNLSSSISSLSDKEDALDNEQLNMIKELTKAQVESNYSKENQELLAENTWRTVKENLSSSEDNTVFLYVNESIFSFMKEYLEKEDSSVSYEDYLSCRKDNNLESCTIVNEDENLLLIENILLNEMSNLANNTTYYIAEQVTKNVSKNVSYETALKVSEDVSYNTAILVANKVKDESISKISSSLNTLYNGVSNLDDGINNLESGISKFNTEGIGKLSSFVNIDLKNMTYKTKNLIQLSNSYSSFALIEKKKKK